jgi:predicted transcriptional regulator
MDESKQPQELPYKARNGVCVGPRYEAIALLEENGFNGVETAQALGITKERVSQIKNGILPKYNLTSRKFIRLAANVVKNTLEGKPTGDVEKIKDSTVLAAAQMVYDRAQPLRSPDQGTGNVSFVKIDMTVYT